MNAFAVAGNKVGVAPAVAFAEPKKIRAVVQPGDFRHHVNPGWVVVLKYRVDCAGGGVGEKNVVGILQTIQMLDGEFVGICGPVHASDVIVTRVAGNLHPSRGTAGDVHDSDTHGGIRSTGNGIGDIENRRIAAEAGIGEAGYDFARGAEVVDQTKDLYTGGVELPVGDVTAVGTPAKSIANVEFFFVNPIGGAVDQGGGAVRGERHYFVGGEVFHINIVGANVGDLGAVGREFRKHQGRGGSVASQFLQERRRPG